MSNFWLLSLPENGPTNGPTNELPNEDGHTNQPKVLASLEVAESLSSRTKGLLGRQNLEGAILIKPAYFSIHTFGMKFPIDVALLDKELKVLKIKQLKPNRITGSTKCRAVVEAAAGSFQKWGLAEGLQLAVKQLAAKDV